MAHCTLVSGNLSTNYVRRMPSCRAYPSVTAMACTSTIISARASESMPIRALQGNPWVKNSFLSWVKWVPYCMSLMNTVMVTISSRVPPALARVARMRSKVARTCPSKSPAYDFLVSSVVAPTPAR